MSRAAEVRIAFRTLDRVPNRYGIRTASAQVTEKRIVSGFNKWHRETGDDATPYYAGKKRNYVLAYRVAGEGWVQLGTLPADAEVERVNGVIYNPPIPAHEVPAP